MSASAESTDPKPPEPKSLLEKMGAALPVALTMIATTFAGMTSSQLQHAMFWRSFAAQDQAKATSQWSFAGFKRDRSLICETTAIQLRLTAKKEHITHEVSLRQPANETNATELQHKTEAAKWLDGAGPPRVTMPSVTDERVQQLLKAIHDRESERDILQRAKKVPQMVIDEAIDRAEKWVDELDKSWDPILKAGARLTESITSSSSATTEQIAAAQAARLDLEQRRYRAEATFNQQLSLLYEARVKVSTAESDKHRRKSENFFYAMLAAQVGATIASLALARKQKSLLWFLAGTAGAVSIAVGVIVFMM